MVTLKMFLCYANSQLFSDQILGETTSGGGGGGDYAVKESQAFIRLLKSSTRRNEVDLGSYLRQPWMDPTRYNFRFCLSIRKISNF